jgi:energy-coupling factor transporter ATP-binding protein EcfA2
MAVKSNKKSSKNNNSKATSKGASSSKKQDDEVVVSAKKEVTPPANLGKSQKNTVEFFCTQFKPEDLTRDEAADLFVKNYGEIIAKHFPNKATEKDLRGMFNYYCTYDKDAFKEPPVSISLMELERPMQTEPVAYEAKTIDLHNVDKELFVPLKTNTAFDKIASKRGGLMKGTAYILTGESGAGKTTIATNIGDYLKEADPTVTVGFVSGEMDETDWTEECFDNPRLAEIPTVFLLNYLDAPNYMDVLLRGLTDFNYCIVDSFEVIIDQLKDRYGYTAKKAETELINLLRQAASKGVTIVCIQQYTKGGTFVGSNKIKHLLTGMMFVMFDKDGDRYIKFTKNRRGGHMVNKKLYYTKNPKTGRLEFDAARFESEEAFSQLKRAEAAKLMDDQGLLDPEIIARAAKFVEERKEREGLKGTSGSVKPEHKFDVGRDTTSNFQNEEEEEEEA